MGVIRRWVGLVHGIYECGYQVVGMVRVYRCGKWVLL